MKAKSKRLAGPTPPILAMVALLLTLGVVATTPLAFAKYVASGMVTASARVAKWAPEMNLNAAANWNATVFMALDKQYWLPVTDALPWNTDNHDRIPGRRTFGLQPVNTDSEVAAKFTYKFTLVADGSDATGWLYVDTRNSANGSLDTSPVNNISETVEPGVTGGQDWNLFVYPNIVDRPADYPDVCYAKIKLEWTATQVD